METLIENNKKRIAVTIKEIEKSFRIRGFKCYYNPTSYSFLLEDEKVFLPYIFDRMKVIVRNEKLIEILTK